MYIKIILSTLFIGNIFCNLYVMKSPLLQRYYPLEQEMKLDCSNLFWNPAYRDVWKLKLFFSMLACMICSSSSRWRELERFLLRWRNSWGVFVSPGQYTACWCRYRADVCCWYRLACVLPLQKNIYQKKYAVNITQTPIQYSEVLSFNSACNRNCWQGERQWQSTLYFMTNNGLSLAVLTTKVLILWTTVTNVGGYNYPKTSKALTVLINVKQPTYKIYS